MARKNDSPESAAQDEQSLTLPQDTDGTVEPDMLDVNRPEDPAAGGASSQDAPGSNPFKRFWKWCATHKKVSLPLAFLVVVAVGAAVPAVRYGAAGLVLKRDFTVTVTDSQTGKPVTSANIILAGKQAQTNNKGQATVKAPVGPARLEAAKKYYKATAKDVVVPMFEEGSAGLKLTATGRQVPVTITNKISKLPVGNAVVKAAGTEVKTDKDGKAVMVLPADKQSVDANITAAGFNAMKTSIKVSAAALPENNFSLVPAGKVYFLSNASGKIDVVKTNLDGSERQVVLAGTGREDGSNTFLTHSKDWKYLALHSKRDGGEYSKLFLIETDTGTTTTIDEGEASFQAEGWSGHYLIYRVDRVKLMSWQPKRSALKSYNAETKRLAVIDETDASGSQYDYVSEGIGGVHITSADGRAVYAKTWYGSYPNSLAAQKKQATINTVNADGSGKKIVKEFSATSDPTYSLYLSTRMSGPNSLYVVSSVGTQNVYEYKSGVLNERQDANGDQVLSLPYVNYLASPDGSRTLWQEIRDGKVALFAGGANAENPKQIKSGLDGYDAYAWLNDQYILLSKKGSELYILPSSSVDGADPIKVGDYFSNARFH